MLIWLQCFHVKMDLWIAKIPILCADSQILRAFFLKIKNAISDFKDFCIKIEVKEQPFKKKQNSQCWSSETTDPYRYVESHILIYIFFFFPSCFILCRKLRLLVWCSDQKDWTQLTDGRKPNCLARLRPCTTHDAPIRHRCTRVIYILDRLEKEKFVEGWQSRWI